MKRCRACGSCAELYNVKGGQFRVSCSATDCDFHGKPGTIDEWCPENREGPICDTVEKAVNSWNLMQDSE